MTPLELVDQEIGRIFPFTFGTALAFLILGSAIIIAVRRVQETAAARVLRTATATVLMTTSMALLLTGSLGFALQIHETPNICEFCSIGLSYR